MKMKTIFLSMLTIAALASCTRQDFIDPNDGPKPGGEGNEMVVELTISSTQLTKAGGAATQSKDTKINDITVFGVNKDTKAVISRQFFSTTSGNTLEEANPGTGDGLMKASFKTTEQTDAIYVIANVGDDLTSVGKPLNLSTIKTLNQAPVSLLITDKSAKQTEENVLMSGYTNEITGKIGVDAEVKASVSLNFIASKVILKTISREPGAKGDYNTNYKFVGAMLTNVNTQAYYFAGDYSSYPLNNPSYIGKIETPNEDRPVMTMQLVSGAKDAAEADLPQGKLEKVTEFYQDLSNTPLDFSSSKPLEDIAYWYVFENSEAVDASGKPTALQLHYQWMQVDQQPMVNKYFSVIFGNDGIPALKPGKVYTVELNITANLLPSEQGGGGPGGDDPEKPTFEGQIGVTVTPANWVDEDPVQKPMGN